MEVQISRIIVTIERFNSEDLSGGFARLEERRLEKEETWRQRDLGRGRP